MPAKIRKTKGGYAVKTKSGKMTRHATRASAEKKKRETYRGKR